jgi:serine/threonine protein kinase
VSSRSIGFTSNGWGSNGYLAPEFLLPGDKKISYNRQVDIWSLGCILYEMVVGRQLFEDNYYAMRYKDNGILPEITFDQFFSQDDMERIRGAFNKMLSLDPEKRPLAKNLVEEIASNYERTTSAVPSQNIEIYEEFSPRYATVTTMMSRTKLTTTPQVEVRTSKRDDQLPLNFELRKALVLNEIEKDPSSFWSWHALSTLLADESNDNIEMAIEACEQGLERFPKSPSHHGAHKPVCG